MVRLDFRGASARRPDYLKKVQQPNGRCNSKPKRGYAHWPLGAADGDASPPLGDISLDGLSSVVAWCLWRRR